RIDRLDTLNESFGKPLPFALQEDARDDVEGDDTLGGVAVAIDREGDAELAEGGFGGLLAALQFGCGRIRDPLRECGKFGPRALRPAMPPDLVKRPVRSHAPPKCRKARRFHAATLCCSAQAD